MTESAKIVNPVFRSISSASARLGTDVDAAACDSEADSPQDGFVAGGSSRLRSQRGEVMHTTTTTV